MVKLYSISILYKGTNDSTILKSACYLDGISYFQRGAAQEFMLFSAKTIVERTLPALRQSIQQDQYFCHVYVRADNLSGVVISDQDYPKRVAHTLITKLLDEFAQKIPSVNWPNLKERDVEFPQANSYLVKYQNPAEADVITKIQGELDETKIVLHNNIQALLDRGEKLDNLVSKSAELSLQSKAFYKTAKKTNACCSYT